MASDVPKPHDDSVTAEHTSSSWQHSQNCPRRTGLQRCTKRRRTQAVWDNLGNCRARRGHQGLTAPSDLAGCSLRGQAGRPLPELRSGLGTAPQGLSGREEVVRRRGRNQEGAVAQTTSLSPPTGDTGAALAGHCPPPTARDQDPGRTGRGPKSCSRGPPPKEPSLP